jgi:alpha-galactosidase
MPPAKAEEKKPKVFKGPVKVFVMAGQSNIGGYAGNPLLEYQANAPGTKAFFAHLRDGEKWVVRDDVFVKFGDRRGPLTIGYGAPGYTGIEYEFGYVMGQYLEEPVLIIKVWGGALYKEFRPPSAPLSKEQVEAQGSAQEKRPQADNEKEQAKYSLPADAVIKAYGGSYRDILTEVTNVFENRDTLFPELKGMPMEVAGFVWFQGFSDQHGGCLTVQNAQWAMNAVPEFKGNVKAFRTDVFVDKPAEALFPTWRENLEEWKKIGSHWACHYYGSALWYTKIGRASGEAMIELLQASPPSK